MKYHIRTSKLPGDFIVSSCYIIFVISLLSESALQKKIERYSLSSCMDNWKEEYHLLHEAEGGGLPVDSGIQHRSFRRGHLFSPFSAAVAGPPC